MPADGQSLGIDYDFGLFDTNTQKTIALGDVQSVKITATKHDIVSRPYNGKPKFAHIDDGYRGTFQVVRTGPDMENLQIQLNANLAAGQARLAGYINKNIRELDGSTSRYQYIGVDFFMTDNCDVSREKNVTQTIEFMASDLEQIA